MKLAKLSLAAIAVVGLSTSSFAADTLADAFKEGTVKGSITSYYFNRDDATGTSGDILDIAVDLNYVTGTFNGFSAGFTFQGNDAPFADTDGKNMYNGDMYGSGAVLSEAYLNYANSGVFVKAGRQYISTPLVAGSGSRAIKQSYEAVNVGYTGLKDTTIIAGIVTKFQARTDGNGNVAEFDKFADDNAYHLYLNNKSVPGLNLTAQYVQIGDLISTGDDMTLLYGSVEYAMQASNTNINFGIQYKDSNDDSLLAAFDGNTLGVMVGADMGAFSAKLAYSQNDSDTDTYYGLGGGADNVYTATAIAGGSYGADESAILLKVGYKMNKMSFYAEYQDTDTGVTNADWDIMGAGAAYSFDGALKGLDAKVQYEVKDTDGALDDDSRFRFVANYSF